MFYQSHNLLWMLLNVLQICKGVCVCYNIVYNCYSTLLFSISGFIKSAITK